MSVAFPTKIIEKAQEYGGNWDAIDDPEDVTLQDPVEDLTHEETLLDDVDIPGLPEDETERHRSWRKFPQRVRIAVRRLHRAFGHVPKSVMVNLVRTAKVSKEFVDAIKLYRWETCEKISAKKPIHKVTLPNDYTFNHTLGIDILELTDVTGQKYQVLNMVCIGICFQQAEVVKVGAGQASSRSCLDDPVWTHSSNVGSVGQDILLLLWVTVDCTIVMSCNNTWINTTFKCTMCPLRARNYWAE